MTTPRFYDATHAAHSLGISVRQVHRMMACGDLPSAYVGRLRRIPARAFDAYIAALQQEAEAAQRQARAVPYARISGAAGG